jgi:tetratricopeptide (TPR) repeat protein
MCGRVRIGRLLRGASLVALTFAPRHAGAAPSPRTEDRLLARSLFDEGRTLMAAHQYAAACEKFEESQRLDPGGGTLLNLALCHERLGKTASAWLAFQDGLRWAIQNGRSDREDFAREHIKALLPRLAQLRIVVPATIQSPGLVVTRNGELVAESAWGRLVPVDPGDYEIAWTAAERLPREVRVRAQEGKVTSVELIPLREAPKSRQALYGIVVGASGVALASVGAYFGLRAMARNERADDLCPKGELCDPRGITESKNAVRDAWIATACTAAGVGLAGVGGYIFLTAPESSRNGPKRPRGIVAGIQGVLW